MYFTNPFFSYHIYIFSQKSIFLQEVNAKKKNLTICLEQRLLIGP